MKKNQTTLQVVREKAIRMAEDRRPVLIAGATASGKSALALEIATQSGGIVVNADALQIYDCWRTLTARPSAEEEAQAVHMLYGHVAFDQPYSVGDWLRDIQEIMAGPDRLIIVGGTGLYFRALTEGLAEIPPVPADVRAEAETILATNGLAALVSGLDPETAEAIDLNNPMRVLRAWEVLTATGRGLQAWHQQTPPPLIAPDDCTALQLDADRDWLNARIATRFDLMLDQGALDEARANQARWDPTLQSSQAIGAPELIGYLNGEWSLERAKEAAIIASQQYAKRQRTWFRKRMQSWNKVSLPEI